MRKLGQSNRIFRICSGKVTMQGEIRGFADLLFHAFVLNRRLKNARSGHQDMILVVFP